MWSVFEVDEVPLVSDKVNDDCFAGGLWKLQSLCCPNGWAEVPEIDLTAMLCGMMMCKDRGNN